MAIAGGQYSCRVPAKPEPVRRAQKRPRADALPRLGHLLKQAYLHYTALTSTALEPLGITAMEWAALMRFDEEPSLSQVGLARLLGVDRTTMVAVIDQLEEKGLVNRRPHRDDRRKNAVELTAAGHVIKKRAAGLVDGCERRFLTALTKSDAQQLKAALQAVIEANSPS
jgi:DNA-binding MarR family transcriptional regulator